MDVCDLLQKLNIGLSQDKVGFSSSSMSDPANFVWRKEPRSNVQAAPISVDPYDAPTLMLENSSQVRAFNVIHRLVYIYITIYYQTDVASDHSKSSSPSSNDDSSGCAYIQAVRRQFDNFTTTGGEYLEAIFTHREIFSAYPEAHRQCARGFSDMAYMLERRAWRADRDADLEAITAFRHEAWAIAAAS